MKLQLAALWSNPHARYAGMIYAGTKLGLRIAEIWFQSYSVNLRLTADAIEGFAVMYGISAAAAGNAPLKEVGEDIESSKAQAKLAAAQDQMRSAARTSWD